MIKINLENKTVKSDYIVMDNIIKDINREIELRERYLEDSRKEMRRVKTNQSAAK